jgi:hypothetical protein
MTTKNELTVTQERAVAALNQALAQARRAHLVICGMDGDLLAYNGGLFAALEASGSFASAYDTQRELNFGTALKARGVYRESGSS